MLKGLNIKTGKSPTIKISDIEALDGLMHTSNGSRKRKLLEKQKEGKKKMKAMGNVNVPSDVFIKMVTKG
jgi:translation elongation factor EF-4